MSIIVNISLTRYAEKMQKEGVNVADNSEVREKIYEILDEHYGGLKRQKKK